jgi:anti-sigma-K factor RskA
VTPAAGRADAHTLVGAYVLGALNLKERALVEEHLDACPACAEEVAELRAVTAALAADVAARPPEPLRPAVLGEMAVTRQLPPAARSRARRGPAGGGSGRPRWTRPLAAVAAALVAVCVGLGAVVADQQGRLDTTRARVDSLRVLASAAVDVPAAPPVAGGGHLAVVSARDQALVIATDLPALPAGRVYQLWLVRSGGGRPASAGTLAGKAGKTTRILDISNADSDVGLTVEPTGGSPQPTTPMLTAVPLRA